MKKSRLLLLLLLLPFLSCVQVNNNGEKEISKKEDSTANKYKGKWISEDEFYSIYFARTLKMSITNQRPNRSDTSIKLCIPAAFTQLDDGSIDGMFIINGKVVNPQKVNHHLGGALLIVNDSVQFLQTNDGKSITNTFVDSISKLQGSLFQQIQLVRNGDNLEFHKDQKLFQRRAVVVFLSGEIAVIESKGAITLQEFSDDLVKMKIRNAIYTDMGSYDEGWVRMPENGAIRVIGKNCSQTPNQSNWLIFSR